MPQEPRETKRAQWKKPNNSRSIFGSEIKELSKTFSCIFHWDVFSSEKNNFKNARCKLSSSFSTMHRNMGIVWNVLLEFQCLHMNWRFPLWWWMLYNLLWSAFENTKMAAVGSRASAGPCRIRRCCAQGPEDVTPVQNIDPLLSTKKRAPQHNLLFNF